MYNYLLVFSVLVLSFPIYDSFAQVDPLQVLVTHSIYSDGEEYPLTNEYSIEKSVMTGFIRIHGYTSSGDIYALYLKNYDPEFNHVFFFKDGNFQNASLKEISTTENGFGGILPDEITDNNNDSLIVESGSKVNVLVSHYEQVPKGTPYVFQVKTFDVNQYDGNIFDTFQGKLDGVNISAKIVNAEDKVIHEFSGITKYGMFESSIVPKGLLWPEGTYTLIVNSEYDGDKSTKHLDFFVVSAPDDSTTPPSP